MSSPSKAQHSTFLRSISSLTLLALFCSLGAQAQPNRYKIHLNFDRPLRATIEAELRAPDGEIFTVRHAGGYAWWDYVKNLRQMRDDGSYVALQSAGDGRWTTASRTDKVARFR